MTNTPEWRVWHSMIQRCSDPNCKAYRYYGGRGIRVCLAWRENFVAFYEHIGPRPTASHQIDRIDNERGYEPGNVRWVTKKEQRRNQRNVVWITHDGRTMPLSEWAETLGVDKRTLWARVKEGWSHERIVTTPVVSTPKRDSLTFRGKKKPLVRWAKEFGLSPDAVAMRLKRGWSVEDALTTPLLRSRK